MLCTQWESGLDLALLCRGLSLGLPSELSAPLHHPVHLVTHLTFLSRGWRELLDNLKRKKKNKSVEISSHLLSKSPCSQEVPGGAAIITIVMGPSKAGVFLGRIAQLVRA